MTMTQDISYYYAVMTAAQPAANVDKTLYGVRVSDDESTVIAKIPTTVEIVDATMLSLPALLEFIKDNPDLWSDPSEE